MEKVNLNTKLMNTKSVKAKTNYTKVTEQAKSRVLRAQEEILKAQEEVRKAEEEVRIQEEEDRKLLATAEEQVRRIATDGAMFCGVVLTQSDILGIVQLAMDTQENIKIPFKMYYE